MFMGCEENFIAMKLIWHSYLVLNLGNCAHETPTETGINHSTKVKCKSYFFPFIIIEKKIKVHTSTWH